MKILKVYAKKLKSFKGDKDLQITIKYLPDEDNDQLINHVGLFNITPVWSTVYRKYIYASDSHSTYFYSITNAKKFAYKLFVGEDSKIFC